ncbi:MAG TPA: RNA polymerase sigma factor [Rhodanobacteraceae bacterium]|nr:RNA polymerase sigma factor [Rhodanobacteraceae bacterium]
MQTQHGSPILDFTALDDDELVTLARSGRRDAFGQIMQRCNQRLFRIARGIVRDDSEAEDVVQESYLHAFDKLDAFRAEASLLTWMTRIVLNEAHGRLRRRRNTVDLDRFDASPAGADRIVHFPSRFGSEDPASDLARAQIRRLLEQAIEQLPEHFRLVFILREIEECTVDETARTLDLRPETVKTRLHRARRLLRAALAQQLSATLTDAFPFLGRRCARMTESVLVRLGNRFVDEENRAPSLPHQHCNHPSGDRS